VEEAPDEGLSIYEKRRLATEKRLEVLKQAREKALAAADGPPSLEAPPVVTPSIMKPKAAATPEPPHNKPAPSVESAGNPLAWWEKVGQDDSAPMPVKPAAPPAPAPQVNGKCLVNFGSVEIPLQLLVPTLVLQNTWSYWAATCGVHGQVALCIKGGLAGCKAHSMHVCLRPGASQARSCTR
jgi:hypothetical protein